MHKTKELTDTMIDHYLSSSITLGPAGGKASETFELIYADGRFQIQAGSPLAALWAAKIASEALETGYIYEVLGKSEPSFPLRPLWFKSGDPNSLLPDFLPYGFNSLVIEDEHFEIPDGTFLIRKPKIEWDKSVSPLDDAYRLFVREAVSSIEGDYLLWESRFNEPSFFSHASSEYMTRAEVIENEIQMLEEMVGEKMRLIYFLPKHRQFSESQLCRWLEQICLRAGKKTVLAFSLPAFWKTIRKSLDRITVPLMPVVAAETDEDEIMRIFSLMKGHHFYGIIAKITTPPKDKKKLRIIGRNQLNINNLNFN